LTFRWCAAYNKNIGFIVGFNRKGAGFDMKLYIKQKVFSWRDKFSVKDEFGNDSYFAQGEIFSWGRKLHVFDSVGREVAFIRHKMLSWRPRYIIEVAGQSYTLVKEFTVFKQRFHVEGLPWRMDGDFWAHEYSMYDENMPVMRMSKHWFTWGDSYELDVSDPQNALICLCVALAIDCMQADAAAAASASSSAH